MATKDLSEMKAEDAIKAAESLSGEERAAAVEAERAGKNRVTVLEALGVEKDPEGTIRSGTGRVLGPQVADPKVAAQADLGASIRTAREELREAEEEIGVVTDTAAPGGDATGSSTPAGTGAAPAPGAGGAGV